MSHIHILHILLGDRVGVLYQEEEEEEEGVWKLVMRLSLRRLVEAVAWECLTCASLHIVLSRRLCFD